MFFFLIEFLLDDTIIDLKISMNVVLFKKKRIYRKNDIEVKFIAS